MQNIFNYLPAHLGLSLSLLLMIIVLVVLTILSASIKFLLQMKFFWIDQKSQLMLKLIGTLSILSLGFAANHFLIYFLSIIVIATLITELDFIEKVTAILSKSPEYFGFREIQEQNKLQEKLEISSSERENLVKTLKKDRDNILLLYHFERTYRLIFGSQLSLLKTIANNPEGITRPIAEAYHRRTMSVWMY